MNTPIKLLLIEDNPGDARLVQEMMKEISLAYDLIHAKKLSEINNPEFKKISWDLILLDLNLPDSEGLSTVLLTQEILPDVPVVVLTGQDNQALSLASIQSGAQDYLVKGEITSNQLQKTIHYAILRYQTIHKINALDEQKKLFFSTHDIVTKFLNQHAFLELVNYNVKKHNFAKKPFAIILIELHEMNKIINSYGHSSKDSIITTIANQIMQLDSKQKAIYARYMEHIICIMITKFSEKNIINDFIENLKSALSKQILISNYNETYIPSYNIGISIFPFDGKTTEILMKNAHKALKKAYNKGAYEHEYCTKYYTKNSLHAIRKNNQEIWHADLQNALAKNEFFLVYQPQLNTLHKEMVGAEVLLRWKHPKYGFMSSNKFIPVAENSRLIISIGEWVLENSFIQFKEWENIFPAHKSFRLGINVSVHQLHDDQLIGYIKDLLKKYQIAPQNIELELTESVFINQPDIIIEKLSQLRSLGIRTAVDDFGQGYSSFSYLSHLPIDQLKIDQSLIKKSEISDAKLTIVKSIIDLAHNLNLNVIAEGVETLEQYELLKKQHCDEVQGFYFSKPLIASEFEKFFQLKF